MSISEGVLFPEVFLDFAQKQLGWDRVRGVTKPKNLRPESDIKEVLIAKSNLKNVRVQVVSEKSFFDSDIKLLKLSDTCNSIYALIWQHTQGCDADSQLLNNIIELHDFDVSARHTPLADSVEQEQLQFSLTIHRLSIHHDVESSNREPIDVRYRANVRSLLQEFGTWATGSDASISDNLSRQTSITSSRPAMDIATQLPLGSGATADDTQTTAASATFTNSTFKDSLRATSKDVKAEIQKPSKRQVADKDKLAHFTDPYDVDEDWAYTISHGRTVPKPRFSKSQEKHLRWAPSPGTEAMEPSIPGKDLLLMSEYADNAEYYIDLLEDAPCSGSIAQSACETQTDVVEYAQKLRQRQVSPEAELIPELPWPASDPRNPAETVEDPTNLRPLSQMGDLDEESDEEETMSLDGLPADTDEEDQQLIGHGSKRKTSTSASTSPLQPPSPASDRNQSLTDKSLTAKPTERPDPFDGLRDISFATSEPLPTDILELEQLLKASRDKSPRHAQIYRALKIARQKREGEEYVRAIKTSPPLHRPASGTQTAQTNERDRSRVLTSPSSQLHHSKPTQNSSTSSGGIQVGRTPFAGSKKAPLRSLSPQTVVQNTAKPPPPTTSSPAPRDSGKIDSLVDPVSRQSSSPLPALPHSPKRKSSSEHSLTRRPKKSQLYKPIPDTFELSQDLQEHVGANYDLKQLRASHFGWAGNGAQGTTSQQDNAPQETPQDSTACNKQGQDEAIQMADEPPSASLPVEGALSERSAQLETLASTATHSTTYTSGKVYATPVPPPTPALESDRVGSAQDVFSRFKSAYPFWTGDFSQFLTLCQKLPTVKVMRKFHDDFIIRHREEYRFYILDCMDYCRDQLQYEEWFQETIESRKYSAGILDRENLQRVLQDATVLAQTPRTLGTESPLPSRSGRDGKTLTTLPDPANRPAATSTPLSVTHPASTNSTDRRSRYGPPRRNLPWLDGATPTTAIELDDANDGNDSNDGSAIAVRTPILAKRASGSALKGQARAMSTASPASAIITTNSREGKRKRSLIIPPELSAADKALLEQRTTHSTKPSAFRKFRKSGPF